MATRFRGAITPTQTSWVRHLTASEGETPVLELRRMWSMPPLFPGPLSPRLLVPARVPSMGLTQSAGAVEYTDYFSWGSLTLLQKCPRYDIKQSYGEVPVVLGFGGMWSTPSLPSLPGPLWPVVVAPDKGPIYGSNRTKLWFWEFFLNFYFRIVWLNWIAWNRNVFDN